MTSRSKKPAGAKPRRSRREPDAAARARAAPSRTAKSSSRPPSQPKPASTKPVFEALEPRVLLSADFVPAPALGPLDSLAAEVRAADDSAWQGERAAVVEAAAQPTHELVFVDTAAPDYRALLDDLLAQRGSGREFEVVLIDSTRDGVKQISAALAARSDLDAVHIVSHGAAGELQLGSTRLDFDGLLKHAGAIKGWGNALKSDADLLLYGCDVARGAEGRSLVDALARLTGADVAASTDLTGAAAKGGDWDLEYEVGAVESPLAAGVGEQALWNHTLTTYTVTLTTDSNPGGGGQAGDLRWAINQANANAGADTIAFNIAGTGTHTIAPAAALPDITGQVTIDATTDDSFAVNLNRPAIVLAGTNAGFLTTGLTLSSTADGSTIRGLVIRDWGGDGIHIAANSDGNLIAGNYIGRLTTTGSASAAGTENDYEGIFVEGANNTVGGTAAADRNVISGNGSYGVRIEFAAATGNLVIGNYIGTDAAGTVAIGNTYSGVGIGDASNNTVGGTTAAERNLLSGNNQSGIELWGTSSGNRVQGNWIGLNASGGALGNSWAGVWLNSGASGNVIGGTAAGSGNVIANAAAGDGIEVLNNTTVNNAFLGNSIYSNSETGIDFADNGVTANDSGDGDTGPNNLQNFPVLTRAVTNASDRIAVGGTLNSSASTFFRIEIFSNTAGDPSGNGEGQTYLGFVNVLTDGSGNATWGTEIFANVPAGAVISATATRLDASRNPVETSEFAANITAVNQTLVVTNTNDTIDGNTGSVASLIATPGADGISLREAITAANNDTTGIDLILFNITGAGPHQIDTATALPAILGTLVIDGTSEPNYAAGTPVVRIDGAAAGFSGISIAAGGAGSTIRGVMITGFTVDGINVASGADNVTIADNWIGTSGTGTSGHGNANVGNTDDGIDIAGSNALIVRNVITNNHDEGIDIVGSGVTGHIIQGNYIGLDPDGSTSVTGNWDVGIAIINGSGNTIGGTTAAERNVISKNNEGIEISTSNNIVRGNYIGTNVTGTLNRGNRVGSGVQLLGSSTNNQVGGTAAGAGNLIAFSAGNGVDVVNGSGHLILGNSIYSNTLLGINLGTAGVTANDLEDGDSGSNNLLNFPVITNVVQNGANLDVTFSVDLPIGWYRIEFYENAAGTDASGFGEGRTFLGAATINVASNPAGYTSFTSTLASVTPSAIVGMSATATQDTSAGAGTTFGSTSEFGPSFLGAGVLVVDTTSNTADAAGFGTATFNIASLLANRGADGKISLREAIDAANRTANIGGTPDQIRFSIPDALVSGAHTIIVGTALPAITDAVVIDATTEPDFAANSNRPVVVLDGNGLAADGLVLSSTADGSTIRGLVIRDFGSANTHDAIEIQAGSDNNTITGNYIGRLTTTGADAGTGEENSGQGLNILGANNLIDGNVISGNWAGVYVSGAGATGNTVVSNLIGTDAAGTVLAGNGNNSNNIDINSGAANNIIGGIGLGNVIVASGNDGISIWGAGTTGNSIRGNTIGTDATGTLNWGNSGRGVIVQTSGNTVGGVNAGEGNVIAFSKNANDGVEVASGATNVQILGNSIYSNTGLGIDLVGANGVNANDAPANMDSDTGSNNLQNFPVLGAVRVVSGTQLAVTGTLNSTANSYFRVEFFASTSGDSTGHGEGQRYLGFADVGTDGSGNGVITKTLDATLAAGEFVSATATKSNATFTTFTDTSEFAQNTVAFEGMALWRTSADGTANARLWDGTAYSPASDAAAIGELTALRAAEAPTRTEVIVIGRTTGDNIVGQMWNGSAWSALPANPLGSYSNSSTWMADVAYESASGDAMIVWGNGTGLSFSVWNGSSWTASAAVSNYAALSGGTAAAHVRLASKPGADEMILAVTDGLGRDYAFVWNGSAWGNGVQVSTGAGSSSAVAYESLSGHAMIAYADAATPTLYYRTWDGSNWSAQQSVALTGVSGGLTPQYIRLASDPTSDRIAMAVTPGGSAGSVQYSLNIWDGSAWVAGQLATASGIDQLMPGIDVAFEGTSGEAVAAYGVNGSNVLRFRTWTAGGGWSAEQNGPTLGAAPRLVSLTPERGTDRVMLMEQDGNSDLYSAQWSGSAWGSANLLDTNTNATNSQPFAFVWESTGNIAPVNTVPGLQVTALNTPLVFSTGNGNAISVADSDDASVSVTLTATNGLLTLGGLAGLSFSVGDGDSDATMTFTGTKASVNAALNGLLFAPTTGFQGIAAVQIGTTDFGAGGTGTPRSDTDSITVEVGAVNHAPVNTVPAAQATDVNGIVLFSSATGTQVSVSDPDAGSNAIQVTLTAANGTLNLSGNRGLSFTTGDGTADATMTFTGSIADINAALNGMTFVAAANFVGTASLQIVTNDLGNSGAGGALSDTDSVSIAVRPVDKSLWMASLNDVSSPGATGLTTWTAGQVLKFGPNAGNLLFEPGTTTGTFSLAGFNLDSAAFSDTNTQIDGFQYVTRNFTAGGFALQAGDLLFSTAANETIGGVAYEAGDIIHFRPNTPGNYSAGTFSLFFDRTDTALQASAFTLVERAVTVGDATLNAGDLLLSDNGSRDILRFVATQYGNTTAGSSTILIDGDGGLAFGQNVAALALVDQTTVIGNTTLNAGTLIVSLVGEDATVGSGTTISVTRRDLFTLDVTTTGNGTTSATATLLFQGADVALDTNNEALQAVTLIPNQAPTVGNQTFGLPENSANGTVVGSVSGTDPEGSTLKYAITAGNVSGAFAINATTGQITVANSPALDFETTPVFALTVAAIDPDGAYTTAGVTVNLSDVDEANDAPTFTTGAGTGKVTTNVSSFWDGASATLIQPDGKIVVAGSMNSGSTLESYVARYNADGTPDPGFGPAGNGVFSFSIQPSDDGLYAMALQSDGKILVAGYARNGLNNDFAIVRLNTNGTLDTTFDGDGIRLIDIAGDNDTARGIAVQSDGKIVVGGVAAVAGNNDFAVVRLNADGSLDTTFDIDGNVTTAIGAGADEARGLAIQTDGRIVLAGYSHNGTNEDVALVRYNTDGSLDTSFDGDGKRTLAIGSGYDVANAVALQSDGKIVVAGDSLISGTPDFTVMRFNADGSLDTSFDTDGIATTAVGGSSDYSKALAIQSDGRIVVVGESFNGSNNDVAVVRYNANGSLDSGFDSDGKLTTAIGSSIDTASGVAVQSDGKIVVAGFAQFADGYTALVRYNTNGSLDTTFGATSTLNGAPTYVENGAAVVLDADVQVTDPELSAAGNYSGATLTLSRHGGANSQDTFSATGNLSPLTQGGNLVLSGVTIGTVTTNSGGTLLLTFNGNATQARVNETLRSIAYANSSDAPPASVQIDWTFSDGNSGSQGSGGALSATGSTTVTMTAVNDAPTATITPLTYTATEQTTLTLHGTGLSVADVDVGAASVTATVSVTSGTLSAAAGTTGVTVAGSGTASVTLTGTLTQINDLLAGNLGGTLTYLDASDAPPASATLTLSVNDGGNSGTGGALAGSDTATINITAVNDAPTATITPLTYAATEQTTLTLHGTGLSVADVDAGASSVTATVSVTSGTLSAAAGTTGVTVAGSGTSSVTLTGTLTQINNLLAGNLGGTLTYIHPSDAPPASATLTLSVNDGGNSGTGGALAGSDTATINIAAVNDAPSLASSYSLGSIAEDELNSPGTLVSDMLSGGFSDPDAGALQGIAVVGVDNTNGTWQYTLNGTNWFAIGNVTPGAARLLPADATTAVRFVPNANYNGVVSPFAYKAWDQTTGTAGGTGDATISGGTTAFSSGTSTTSVTVTAVNDAPTATITPLTYAATEQTTLTLHGTGLSVADVDAGASSVTATVSVNSGTLSAAAGTTGVTVAGSGTASVTLTGTLTQINNLLAGNLSGTLTYLNSSDAPPASATLTLSLNDGGNTGTGGALVGSDTATINLTAVNDAPTATITPLSYAATEQTTLTLHGTGLSVADVDAGSASVTATVSVTSGTLTAGAGTTGVTIGGSGTASVTLTGTLTQINDLLAGNLSGTLTYFNASDTPPASATLTLSVNDGGNTGTGSALAGSDTATISLTTVNDAPVVTIVPATYSATEQTDLALQGTGISVADPDAGGATINLTLSVGSGTLTVVTGTTGASAGAAGSSVLVIGTLTQLNDLLAGNLGGTISYVSASDTPPAGTVLTVSLNDGGVSGTGGPQTGSDTATINLTAVNDAPTATITPASYAATEQTPLTLHGTGLSVADVDAAAASVTATVSVTSGTLTAAAGTTGVTIGGSGSATVTLTGTLAQINDLLAGSLGGTLTYLDSSDTPAASATLTLSVNDGGNTGSGGALAGSDTATINLTAVNDTPTATITPLTYAATEQTTLTLHGTGLSVADVDAGASSVTATVSVNSGTLSAAAGTTGVTVAGSGTASVTLTGTLTQINNLLAGNLGGTLTYINSSDAPPASATLTLSINDGGNTGSGGALAGSDTATINIAAVNDAPTATITPASYSATEQTTLTLHGTGLSVADVDAGSASVTATVSVTSGTLTAGAGTTGVTIGGSGTASVTLTGMLTQINNLLAGNLGGTLTYINSSDAPPASATLTLSLNDGGNSGSGGALAGSDTATINIAAVNDAPTATITPATYSATEQTSLTLHGTGLSVADVDAGSASVTATVSVTSGTVSAAAGTTGVTVIGSGTASVTLTGTLAQINDLLAGNLSGTLTYFNASDTPPASATLTLSVNDGGNTGSGGALAGSDTATIDITAVNDAPTLGNGTLASINEDTTNPAGETVATIFSGQFADVDAGASLAGIAVVGNTANAGTQGTWQYSTNGGSNWFAIGTVADNTTALALSSSTLVRFVPLADYNGTPPALVVRGLDNTYAGGFSSTAGSETRVTVNTTTNGGSTPIAAATANLSTSVTAVNDPPVNTTPSGQYTPFNTALVFSSANGNPISIADPDAAASPVQVTLTVGNGTLTLAGTAGLTITGGANGSATMTFAGTVASINTALNGLTYSATANYRGLDTLQIATSDLGNTGSGGPLTDTDGVKIYAGALVVTNTSDTSNGNTTSISALAANDGGDGISLREAIIAANNTGGADTIAFSIAGTGVHTIAPTVALPTITGQVTIDASTDDSFAANGNRPAIVLAGTNAGIGVDGLVLASTADGSTIRGFVIQDWGGSGIVIQAGSDSNLIAGNYIGRLTAGGEISGAGTENAVDGVLVQGNSNTIGGSTAADRNVISGNGDEGIDIDPGATGNVIRGNYVGTNATGMTAIPNGAGGLGNWGGILVGGSNTTIGGVNPGEGNLVSGNYSWGILVETNGNVIQGNSIGVAVDGTTSMGNTGSGIIIIDFAGGSNNLIGGTAPGAGNVIANNGGDGVNLASSTALSNAILGNRIFNNADLGIDLDASGVTANDAGDGDTGANNLQNFPVLTSANSAGGNTTIVGTLNSTANTTLRIEFFSATTGDGSGHGEGQTYLGSTTVITDGSGNASFTQVLTGVTVTAGHVVSATATVDLGGGNYGSTSEFAANVVATNIGPGINVSAISGSTSEAGATATFTVALNTAPTADVTIAVSSSNTLEGTVSTSLLTFTSANWNVAQTVTVTGVDDSRADGNAGYTVLLAPATSTDGGYSGLDASDVAVTNIDNDSASITVTPVSVSALGGETRVNTTTGGDQNIGANVSQAIATDANGNFVVVWASNLQDGALYGIYGQRFSADGTALGGEFLVNTTTADDQILPSVAMDATGNFVVTWSSNNQDGSGYGVYAQRYDSAGMAQGAEFRVSTTTAGSQITSQIAMSASGSFVIVWSSAQDPDASTGIYGQRYDAAGVAQGGEFRVNSYTVGIQQLASVAMSDSGSFVVTWASDLQDGSGYGVYGQLFASNGAAQGSEFRVNTTTANSQLYNDVAMLGDGRFVVVYESRNADGTFEVFLQRYAANGTAIGSETRVNTTTVSSAQQPISSVSADAGGNITVVWNSAADGLGVGVVGQRFSWNGSAIGAEFQVNTTTSGNQLYAEVASQPGGRFIVAWGGNGTGDADGVFFQRYGLATTEAGTSATLQVGLTSQPTADVTITIASGDATEGTVSPTTLTFTAANWNVLQTVTVFGLQDYVNDGDVAYTVVTAAATSSDINYGGLNAADVSVTNREIPNVTPVNSVPAAQAVNEDGTLVFSSGNGNLISIGDGDAGSNAVQVTLTGTNGTLTLAGTTGLSFTVGAGAADATMTFTGSVASINAALAGMSFSPTANFNGAASLQIVTNDQGNSGTGGALSDTDTVAITVTPVNDPTNVTGATTGSGNEDAGAISGTLTATDADGLADGTVFTVSAAPTRGSATIDAATGAWSYTPTADYYGNDSFTVTITDDANNTTTQVISLMVSAVADIVDDTLSTNEDTPVTITAASLLTNDSFENAGATVTAVGAAGNGTVSLVGGNITYNPNAHFNGTDSFSYTVTSGGVTETATVNVTVNQVNDAATFGGDVSGTGAEDGAPITGTLTVSDPADGMSAPNFTVSAGAANGTASINATTGLWSYTPNADWNGTDSFTVSVTDDDGNVETQVISLTVTQVNDPASFGGNTSGSGAEDGGPVTGTLTVSDLADGMSAPGFSVSGAAANGVATINATTGAWSYSANANFNGTDSFAVSVTDDDGNVETQVISLTVTQVNDPASFGGNTSGSGAEDGGPITGTLTVSDPADGMSAPNFTVSAAAANGTASINATTGLWSYTPNADWNATDSFTVSVTDDDGNVETRLINLTVSAVADIVDDTVSTSEDTPVTVNVLTNDSFEGSPVITAVTNGVNGTVAIGVGGNVTYTPNGNFNGSDSFSYTVTSGGVTETATVTVTVNAANDAPENTVPGAQTTNEDAALVFSVANGNAITVADVDGGALTTTVSIANGTLTAVTGGGATITDNGTGTVTIAGTAAQINAALNGLSYAPTADYNGAATLTVATTDGTATDTDTVAITVNAVADIVADTVSTNEDTAITFNAITGVGGGSADHFENAGRAVTGVTQGTHGTVSFLADGSITYTPNGDFNGTDSFSYTVTSGGVTETATVNVTVTQVNDAASFGGNTSGTGAEDGRAIGGTLTVSDPADGMSAPNFTVSAAAANGTASINATTGLWSYTPNADWNGTDSFTVSVTDDDGNVETRVISLTVTPVNDAPTGTPGITGAPSEDQTLSADVSSIADADGLGAFAYQWLRDGVDIAGATSDTYTLGDADVDTTISVRVSYTDGGGTAETLTSASVGPVAETHTPPTPPPVPPPAAEPIAPPPASDAWIAPIESPVAEVPVATPSANVFSPNAPTFIRSPTATAKPALPANTPDVVEVAKPEVDKAQNLVANHDSYETTAGATLRISGNSGLLANDAGLGGGTSIRAIQSPASGTLRLDTNGGFTYIPRLGFSGADSFVYEIRTADGRSATATVRLLVSAGKEEVAPNAENRLAGSLDEEKDRVDDGAPQTQSRVEIPAVAGPLADTQERRKVELVLNSVRVTGLAVSVGAVWWAVRAGGLIASLLASAPAWRHLDPLPVLGRPDDEPRDEVAWGDGEDAEAKRDEVAVSVVLGNAGDGPR